MSLGRCRFCGAGRIAADAPVCRTCGGWYPNPGFFSRLGATFRLLFGLLLIAGAGAGFAYAPDAVILWGLVGLTGLSTTFYALVRPYGKPAMDRDTI